MRPFGLTGNWRKQGHSLLRAGGTHHYGLPFACIHHFCRSSAEGNQSGFQRYIRKHIPTEDDDTASKNLRLQIDVTTSELIAQLKLERDSVINVGFTFGFNERRVRGRLNAVIASCWEEELVAAYVLE